MTPEEAQRQTEEQWKTIIRDDDELIPECGWCEWASTICINCPVSTVFGITDSSHIVWCLEIEEYQSWVLAPYGSEAQKVYDLLISKRDELIAAAKEIENET